MELKRPLKPLGMRLNKMNKKMNNTSLTRITFFTLTFLLSVFSYGQDDFLLSQRDEGDALMKSLKNGEVFFTKNDRSMSSSILFMKYQKLSVSDLARLTDEHSQWRTVDEMITMARLFKPGSSNGRSIYKAIKVCAKINMKATVQVLNDGVCSAVKNEEVEFISYYLDWMLDQKLDSKLTGDEWIKIINCAVFTKYVMEGPSLLCHTIFSGYNDFLLKNKMKGELDEVIIASVNMWENDPFMTKTIVQKINSHAGNADNKIPLKK